MKTLLTAIGTLSACTTARWFLDNPRRKEKRCAGDRVRLTALWNEGAAFGLKIPKSIPNLEQIIIVERATLFLPSPQ